MRAFILIFLALHIPLFVYPVLRLGAWLELDILVVAFILVPVASSQVISRWLLRNPRHPGVKAVRQIADFILGMSPIALMCLLVTELLVYGGFLSAKEGAYLVIGATTAISALGLVIAAVPFVRRIDLALPGLKAPLRMVQITDVHIGSRNKRFLEQLVTRIRKLKPDLLCITGDFIDARGIPEKDLVSLQELDCPAYFCIGNHERYEDLNEIVNRLRNLGVTVLRNQSTTHRDDVQVIGIDDRDDVQQVERQLDRLEVHRDMCNILMYHRPTGLEAAAAHGIDLMISGHTHNGQIFPFNFIVKSVFERIAGMYEFGDTRLYVSQGTGTWGPVMRVGTRSEITLFELECAA